MAAVGVTKATSRTGPAHRQSYPLAVAWLIDLLVKDRSFVEEAWLVIASTLYSTFAAAKVRWGSCLPFLWEDLLG